ncbi:type II toxin-antitoxin system RelE family toxin [Haloactinomyces albus]|uniref:mRNA-degrading endonuclease RelE of RelBE toxin-antitoxin system n=1 Tax=Haloactinomyces albus TaxID=1352928 RepID=A0AAE4CKV1_9ACTN|nr:type II toxin-antitoxin system RelE/ParE family toxin [Haloactinomyces albus]MDR7301134.1 mRNA-degrading endonuclease RelE of RelBE toxin-antitoxin system [Haloactinomyces albus]
MNESPYELEVAGPAARAIQYKLPETVASAVIEFITGALLDNPHEVGKELIGELTGNRSARRGAYRVLYRIDERRHLVVVLRIEHRADVYRPR